MAYINLDIVTPEKKVFSGEVKSITAPGIEGEFGVLPGHAPFATVISAGVVEIKPKDGHDEMMAVSGGYIEVTREKVVLLVESADTGDEASMEEARKRKEQQEKLLKGKTAQDTDYEKLQAALQREIMRMRAIEILQKKKKV